VGGRLRVSPERSAPYTFRAREQLGGGAGLAQRGADVLQDVAELGSKNDHQS
jgi:hypothetical protein